MFLKVAIAERIIRISFLPDDGAAAAAEPQLALELSTANQSNADSARQKGNALLEKEWD